MITSDDILQEKARRKILDFIDYCWQKPSNDKFIVGFHTRKICDRIDKALKDLENGISSFVRIAVHPRAGKSDIVSRFLPAYAIGKNPESEILVCSYSADLSKGFTSDARRIATSENYRKVFNNIEISDSSSAKDNWSVKLKNKQSGGKVYGSGLVSGITGKGYSIGILDDYISGRSDAESEVMRAKLWDCFTNDFLTRRAPVSFTLVIGTCWHSDDIHGRIGRINDPDSPEYDANFPKFETLIFPARAELYEGEGIYPGKFLFGERFSDEYYEAQYASLGKYASSALMDSNPVPRGGSIINTENIKYYNDDKTFPPDLRFMRVWDMAHTAKQRAKSDPDFTGGTLLAYRQKPKLAPNGEIQYELYIKDYSQFRETAPNRDAKIKSIADADGQNVKVIIENSLDSKDAGNYLAEQFRGYRTVEAINCKGDKLQRTAEIESIFERGDVHVIKGQWNAVWANGLTRFDGSGKSHDEMVDNITCGWQAFKSANTYKPVRAMWG